jgi:hypothetical protein
MRAKYDVRVVLAPGNSSIFIEFLDTGRVRLGLDPATAGIRMEPERKCSDLGAAAAGNVDISAEKGQRRLTLHFNRMREQ